MLAAEKVPTSSILKSRTTGARPSTSLPFDSSFFDVHIPEPRPEVDSLPPIQIPYVPDFWDSSNVFSSPELDEPHPKIVVVAGAETHIGGGPSHNLFDTLEESTEGVAPAESGPKFEHSDSLLDDITEDLGLPPAKEIKASFWKMFS
ncbi:hypothetical protein NLJ89_g11325 [Agrocybe chaxingu]|uniref:Uncharacterized protein n=1 Tax=Agrocybe chaxingu TaxID=84603 RepID=A0A9W8JQ58_9AGAR|nr:hypothetical protein NLJ89_g11325 [Agrocybe chaxingu]